MTTYARDLSNYTTDLTPAMLDSWKKSGVGLAIIQAVNPPAGYPPTKTRVQIQQCQDAGLVVDAYIWLWFASDISDIQNKLHLLDGFNIRQLWLDVEDVAAVNYDQATTEALVNEALIECDNYPHTSGQPTGVYTGRWFWADKRYLNNSTTFSNRRLWDSNYDNFADTTVGFTPYGGWSSCAIKQYLGSQPDGTDLDVLSTAEEALLVTDPERQQMQDKINFLVSTIGLLCGDDLKPLVRKNAPQYVQNYVTVARKRADDAGVNHI